MLRFRQLQRFLSLGLLGPRTCIHIETICSDLRTYIKGMIHLIELNGYDSDARRLISYVYRHRRLRHDDYVAAIECYLRHAVLEYIERQGPDFPYTLFTNTRQTVTSLNRLHQVTFAPLMSYMKSLDEDLWMMRQRLDEWLSTCEEETEDWRDADRELSRLRELWDLETRNVTRVADNWVKHWNFVVDKGTELTGSRNNPYDTAFELFIGIHKNLTRKIERMKRPPAVTQETETEKGNISFDETLRILRSIGRDF